MNVDNNRNISSEIKAMILNINSPVKALNKAYRKVSIAKSEFENFKSLLGTYLQNINLNETEEHLKQLLRDLLKNSFYQDFEINTSGRADLAIFLGKTDQANVGVILEVKHPGNKVEMISSDDFNKKALHEAILYYFRERIEKNNYEIKNIVVTNLHEFFIFDAHEFDLNFYKTKLKTEFNKWNSDKSLSTDVFYNEIAKPFINDSDKELNCTHFDIRDYQDELTKDNSKKLIALFKLFSPPTLIKEAFANDSNSLNKQFYFELLHLIGLEEVSDRGKKLISRVKDEDKRSKGSLIENTIKNLMTEGTLSKMSNIEEFGETKEEQLFTIALELNITWINRILFLKLLEAQLLSYHNNDQSFRFLDYKIIKEFDDLNELFFDVLAKTLKERDDDIYRAFKKLPYLNSSLFEKSDLEYETIGISNLRDRYALRLYSQTVLKDDHGNRLSSELPILEYLFKFLDAYDFSSEGAEDVKEDKKSLINASVLGLIFEKINGYKEGSFFTPGYITMYICRETIRRAALQKFKDAKGWQCDNIDQLYNKIDDLKEANDIINSIKVCDPAVGSGHFLVSALNEIIALKSELGVLCYHGTEKKVKDYKIEIQNDELVVTDKDDDIFEYKINTSGKPVNTDNQQLLQETLFHEKQTIIENCLFGVDINPNSVNICRLRLWIELLKNTYYTENSKYTQLETLPNIDINIKCGNSLVSRFDLHDKQSQVSAGQRNTFRSITNKYKDQVLIYKTTSVKAVRQMARKDIEFLKDQFSALANPSDDIYKKIRASEAKLKEHESSADKSWYYDEWKKEHDQIMLELTELSKQYDEKQKTLYSNAFEWRFEFPEVLDEDGKFIGFDAVIGNPPYIQLQTLNNRTVFLKDRYKTYAQTGDMYVLFYELAANILKAQGNQGFITGSAWLRTNYGKSLRKFFIEDVNIHKVIDFSDCHIFDSATVLTTVTFFTNKSFDDKVEALRIIRAQQEEAKEIEKYFNINHIILKDLTDESWVIANKEKYQIKQKVEAQGIKLKDWDIDINYGIKTGLNDAFIIDGKKKDELIAKDPNSAEIIKPLLRGRDIKRYGIDDPDLWLIFTAPALKLDIEKYTAIKSHLESFGRERLEQSGKKGSRKKTTNQWFELQDTIAYYESFLKPKIIYPVITKFLPFVFDRDNFFFNDKVFMMVGQKLEFLTGFLNSKLFKYCFTDNFPELQGNSKELRKVIFQEIPVKLPSEEEEKPFVALVNEILAAKKADAKADTSAAEAEIDRLVYKLYDLTEEEISIIESEG